MCVGVLVGGVRLAFECIGRGGEGFRRGVSIGREGEGFRRGVEK